LLPASVLAAESEGGASESPAAAGTLPMEKSTSTNALQSNYNPSKTYDGTPLADPAEETFTITGQPTSVTYGDNGFTLEITGGSGTGDVTWKVTAGMAASVDSGSGAVKISGVGEVTITATKAGDSTHEEVRASWTFTVQKKPVTAAVAANDKTYDGNTTATVTATVTEGLVGSDSITITGLTGTFADANVGEDKAVTVDASHAQVSGANSECYEITYPATTTATISKDISGSPP
jgi:hypothetical protein